MFQGGQNVFLPHLYYFYASNLPFSNEMNNLGTWPTSSNLVAEDLSTKSKHHARYRMSFMDTLAARRVGQQVSPRPAKTGFSIADILRKDTEPSEEETERGLYQKIYQLEEDRLCSSLVDCAQEGDFSWLQCTRYKPPKLPRLKKKDGVKKRKLGRNPRVPFTQHQVNTLEQKFRRTHYLSSLDVAELSTALNLTETRVKIWFQNRRARERRERDGKGLTTQKSVSTVSKSSDDSSCSLNEGSNPNTEGDGKGTWYAPIPPTPTAITQFTNAVQNGTSAFSPVSFSPT